MYSIGIDVSKSSLNIHIPKNNLDLKIENNLKALKALYSKLKKIYKKEIDKLTFVYEPTGSYSALLYRFCAEKKIRVFMINPKQARNFAKAVAQRNKSDKIDAKVLSQAIVVAKESEIVIPYINPIVEEIKELIAYYKLKVKLRVQLNNHLESLKAKEANKTLIASLKKDIAKIKKEEETIMESICNIIIKDKELKAKYESIISIDGIGKVAAIVLLHLFIKYPNANQRQIVSLTGLDPIVKESGSSIRGKTKISKAGGRIYRGTLFMPVMVAIRHNNQIKEFYTRLKENGKHTTVAQVAVMRKLIVIAHSLYKSGEFYDKERYLLNAGIQKEENLAS
jgi:transposase